jgi:hypothetical protein
MAENRTRTQSSAFESIRRALLEARDHARGKDIGARVHEVRVMAAKKLPRSSRRKPGSSSCQM